MYDTTVHCLTLHGGIVSYYTYWNKAWLDFTLTIYGVKDKDGRRKKGIDKAEFALQLLYNKDPQKIAPPSYIAEALQWLEDSLIQREDEDFASEGEV